MRNKQRSERTSASINIDIEQAWQHLELLDPEAPTFTFQTFDDDKSRKSGVLAKVFNGSLDEFADEFEKLQKRGAGLFITVNETDFLGRKNSNMQRPRAVWQEDDEDWQGDFPLPPSLVIKTSPGKHHRYWFLSEGEELSRQEHAAIIDRMVQDYGSDKGAKGFNRVMRLAGYLHQKGEPFQTHIVEASGKRYTRAELLSAFPPLDQDGSAKRCSNARQYGDNRPSSIEITEALSYIPAGDRQAWLDVGMALHDFCGGSSEGYALWDEWSQRASDKYDGKNQKTTWNSFKGSGHTIKTVFEMAKQQGCDLGVLARKHRNGGNSQASPQKAKPPAFEPLPLMRVMPKGEEFPVEALGSILGEAAKGFHAATQAPMAICGNAALAVANLACQAHADVRLPTKQVVPLSCLLVTIAGSGERKSATDNRALEPSRIKERQLRQEHDEQIEAFENRHDAWKAKRQDILKAKKLSADEKKFELDTLGSEPLPPLTPILTTSEPTAEGLAKLLIKGHPSVGVFAGEGGQFIGGHGFSDDAKLRTATFFSRLWDDGTLERVRAGETPLKMNGKRVCMHLLMQPDVATRLFSDPVLADQGFLSRILPAAPESMMGKRPWRETAPEHHSAVSAYKARMAALFERPLPLAENTDNELDPRILELSAEAREMWISLADHIEAQLGQGGAMEPISGLANKLPEHAARIAGILALVDDPETGEISRGHLQNGIELVQYYASEAYKLFGASRVDAGLAEAEKLLNWLHNCWQEPNISLVDAYQRGPNSIRDHDRALGLIEVLEKHGQLVRIEGGAVVNSKNRRDVWKIVNKREVK